MLIKTVHNLLIMLSDVASSMEMARFREKLNFSIWLSNPMFVNRLITFILKGQGKGINLGGLNGGYQMLQNRGQVSKYLHMRKGRQRSLQEVFQSAFLSRILEMNFNLHTM